MHSNPTIRNPQPQSNPRSHPDPSWTCDHFVYLAHSTLFVFQCRFMNRPFPFSYLVYQLMLLPIHQKVRATAARHSECSSAQCQPPLFFGSPSSSSTLLREVEDHPIFVFARIVQSTAAATESHSPSNLCNRNPLPVLTTFSSSKPFPSAAILFLPPPCEPKIVPICVFNL